MPIYEYACQNCRKDFELLVSASSGRPSCPDCGSKKVSKKFSTFAAHQESSTPACAEGACPGGGGRKSACAGGKCPFA